MLLSRINHKKLGTDSNSARAIRRRVIEAHLNANGSQNQLRGRVREILGESGIVSSETLAAGIEKADSLLGLDPEDLRHLLFETVKGPFYAIRKFKPEDLENTDIDEFMTSADILSGTIYSIEQRIKSRNQTKKTLEGFSKRKTKINGPLSKGRPGTHHLSIQQVTLGASSSATYVKMKLSWSSYLAIFMKTAPSLLRH
jgi:hypothetical protein